MNIRIPVSWLRDYLKTDVAAKTIAQYLTTSGPSVERIEKHGEDLVFDIEVTTNRPDAVSILGIAREAHAILTNNRQKSQLVSPKGTRTKLEPDIKNLLPLDVIIKDKGLCPRFNAIVVDNVKIKPSPAFIKNRLEASGIRAINNIVDISNYIMLELGQPMHAFDYDKIKGAKMVLRESTEGERIKTLDGQTRKLPKGTIVIEDAERLIDLCGIMGGENSAVSSRTKRVVLFVQSYNRAKIRKTTQTLAFRTEAAARFEKGIDLEGIILALSRAVYLAKLATGAKIASELIDIYPNPPQPKPITLSLEKLNDYLGIEIPTLKAQNILKSLGFKIEGSPNLPAGRQAITATPPSWRANDCQIQEDLIEEIARVYGYHNLPNKLPDGQIPDTVESPLVKVIELKKALKYLGLTEIISYSLISKEFLHLTGLDPKDAVELANPLTEQWQFIRPTLLISLVSIIGQNQNLRSSIKLFEIAKTYLPSEASAKEGEKDTQLPIQDLKTSIVLWPAQFSDIKGIVENLFDIVGRTPSYSSSGRSESRSKKAVLDYARTINSALFEKSQSAQIKVGDTVVGSLGILKSAITDYFEIDSQVAICEINLSTIYQLPTTNLSYKPIPKYSPVIEDISAIFDQKIPVGEIVASIQKIGEPLVKKVEIIDIYQDEKIGKGKKSITLRLTYQKSDSTPSQEEVTRFREIISREITRIFKAHVRR